MKSKELINKIEKIIQREINNSTYFKFKFIQEKHIIGVRDNAVELAKKLNADVLVVEVAALLHDIGRLKFGAENHEVTSAEETERILKKLNCDFGFIKRVKQAVLTHCGNSKYKPKELEDKIVSCADAMSHFNIVPELLVAVFARCNNIDEAKKIILMKLERAWKKVLRVPIAKVKLNNKYKAIKIVLK